MEKRSIIMFTTYKCGEATELHDVNIFILKIMPSTCSIETGDSYDDFERHKGKKWQKKTAITSVVEAIRSDMQRFTKSFHNALEANLNVMNLSLLHKTHISKIL